MKKYKQIIILISFFNIYAISECFGQETFTYNAIIKDSITENILKDVIVYIDKDSIGSKNNSDGSLTLNVKEGSIIRLRKKGYQWLNFEVKENSAKTLKMVASTRPAFYDQIDEILLDGKSLPKEDWNDINPNYLIDVKVEVENKKTILIVETQ